MFGGSQGSLNIFGASLARHSPAKGDRKDLKEICLPVTIRAIELAVLPVAEGFDDLKFFGQEVSMLILVAAVESVNKQGTCMELTVNDGTGRMKARYFMLGDKDNKVCDDIVVGRYVEMFGDVRTAPYVHLAVNGIAQVKSGDEVSYHTIEAAHSFLKMQRSNPASFTSSPKKAIPTVEEQSSVAAQIAVSSQATELAAAPATFTNDQLKISVLALSKEETYSLAKGEVGYHIDELVSHFASAGAGQVKNVIIQLIEDGDVFTTIDDNHFGAMID
ncbi:unnamed protein product [Polarella glacialis]|uniref:Replication protein A C-terminal domain-containing protein n=1 Tax=Polarella glacialis TaxID=89957 RepID=A0A813IK89_POLGL|nr:unnamed protein product [Polarella glacialis]